MNRIPRVFLCALCLALSTSPGGSSEIPNRSVRLGPILSSYVEQGFLVSIAVKSRGDATVLDGPFSVRFAGGGIAAEGELRNGQFHGPYLSYDSKGQMRSRVVYRDGVPVGEEVWWDASGAVSRILNLDEEGALHGIDRYFSAGTLLRTIEWDHGDPIVMHEYGGGEVVRTSSPEQIRQWFDERKARKEAQPGATDNPDDAQRLREDH